MIRRQKLHAIIVERRNVGEADWVVTLLTRQSGVMRVLAKGARRIPSRRGGHLEPLSHVVVLVNGAGAHFYLAAVDTVNDFRELKKKPAAIEQAQSITIAAVRLLPEGEPVESLFDAIHHSLTMLAKLSIDTSRLTEVAILLLVLRQAGIQPQLEKCLVCGATRPTVAVVLDSADGGFKCLTCHQSFSGTRMSLTPKCLNALRYLAQYPERATRLRATPEDSKQILASIRSYLSGASGAVPHTAFNPNAYQTYG